MLKYSINQNVIALKKLQTEIPLNAIKVCLHRNTTSPLNRFTQLKQNTTDSEVPHDTHTEFTVNMM